ncbi:hypothetical protein [Pedobacter zeae]|uniref:Uncharacterized protein n=1 Tax=Pedobacter zeae TaxID=1737356 RepID=A0A7W6P548_9SPHI|nr:hypothetical protein [Pedobacter zeae]MBB4107692.1 hypothetical protein [Pedobacter zeae]GGG97672.1 hypothetical protein GCM10007422_09600 [Pedobacter zeae]
MIQHNQETKNAIKAIDVIKRLGIADSDADIAKSINYSKQSLNNARNALRNLPLKYLDILISNYHLNPNFIYKNNLPVFDSKGPFDKYNNLADPSNQDVMDILDRIEKNQVKMMELLLKLVQK